MNDLSLMVTVMGRTRLPALLSVLKENKVVVLFCVAIALYYAAYHQYGYLMPLDMGKVHGENGAALYGTVSSLNCIVVVIFTPIITRIFKNIINTRKILIGQALVLVGYVTFLLFLGRIAFYYVAMLLFTWGEIFTTISEGPYTSTRMPASHRGRINGFNSLLNFVLQSASLVTRKNFGWGFWEASSMNQLAKCVLPMLFIHGDADDFVPFDHLQLNYDAKIYGYKEKWVAPGAVHANSYAKYPEEYTKTCANFLATVKKMISDGTYPLGN